MRPLTPLTQIRRRPVRSTGAHAWNAGALLMTSVLLSQLACVRALVPSLLGQEGSLTSQVNAESPADHKNPLQGEPDADYGVVWVGDGATLTVRQIAGSGAVALEELSPQATGLQLTGDSSLLGSSLWVEVLTSSGSVGWVNAWNLAELAPEGTLCADPRASEVVDRLGAAVRNRDMAALSDLLPERRGLVMRLSPHAPEVIIPLGDVPQLLQNPAAFDWGPTSDTGEIVVGTFAEAVVPRLESVFGSAYEIACNQLLQGQTARPAEMPMELRNLGYFSAYLPAQGSATGMDWQTWAVVIEYVGGEPRIGALVRFQGEI